MVCEIKWESEAIESYIQNIQFLEAYWTKKESSKFKQIVLEIINTLKIFPKLGKPSIKRKDIRSLVIHKKITLYYFYNKKESEVVLLHFWNTLQNPQKNKL